MTVPRKYERYAVLVFMAILAFFTYRSIQRKEWLDEFRYQEGKDRAQMVYIHKFMGGVWG